jgi:LuxR family maltose regulon positive regulatory protein
MKHEGDDPLLITTKLAIPPTYLKKIVPRPHVYELLNSSLQRPLVLVTAPAGFGKTTLISAWLRQQSLLAAWLSLEESDNDLIRFWSYIIRALYRIYPELAEQIKSWSTSKQEDLTNSTPTIESMLTTLINTLMNLETEIILVLDNYQTMSDPQVHQTLTFFIEHLPPLLHLILITRYDPPLPLARLRVQGKLIELSAPQLRFTLEETTTFLTQAMGLDLRPEEISALAQRTEGWIAALQLAALSLQSRQENAQNIERGGDRSAIAQFIQAFTGTNKHIATYLTDEVLQQQPEEIQQFLLQTSILDRLTASLCDQVTQQQQSENMLERLEQNNLFLVPLDNQQHWFRYNYLFTDFLRHHLKHSAPEQIAELHQRASAWYEQNGMFIDAIKHAQAASDSEHAADLIEQHARSFIERGEETQVYSWLTHLPTHTFEARPMLSFLHACMLLSQARMDAYEQALTNAEKIWQKEQCYGMLSCVYDLRALVALYHDDGEHAVTYAHKALDLEQEHGLRGSALVHLGAGYLKQGNIEQAIPHLAEGYRISQKYLNSSAQQNASIYQGEVALVQGNLHAAMQIFQHIVLENTKNTLWIQVAAHTYLSDLYREWNDLPSALEQSQQALRLTEQVQQEGFATAHRFLVAARIAWLQDHYHQALNLLDLAEQSSQRFGPNPTLLAQIIEQRIRFLLQREERVSAQQWLKQYAPEEMDGLPSYAQEYWGCARARLLLDAEQNQETLQILEPLYQRANQQKRTASEITLLILRTLAYHSAGNTQQTLHTLEQTLMLAEQGGYTRIFIDEGAVMAALLTELYSRYQRHHSSEPQHISLGYIYTLLHSFGTEIQPPIWLISPENEERMIEKLSEREYMVLGLIAEGLSNQEIAQKLVVTVSTIKTHLNNIYAKLHVHTRLQAVTRAYDLGILRRSEIDTEPLTHPRQSERR